MIYHISKWPMTAIMDSSQHWLKRYLNSLFTFVAKWLHTFHNPSLCRWDKSLKTNDVYLTFCDDYLYGIWVHKVTTSTSAIGALWFRDQREWQTINDNMTILPNSIMVIILLFFFLSKLSAYQNVKCMRVIFYYGYGHVYFEWQK